MSRIKIIHILNSVGGVDVSLRLILENIDSKKFESIVIHGTADTKTPYVDNLGNPVVDYKVPIQRDISLYNDLSAIKHTLKILKKEQPLLIHAHSAKGGIIAKIIASIIKVPVLHTPQAYSYLSAQSNLKKKLFLSTERLFVGLNNKILASSTSEQNRAINEVGYPKEKVLLFNNSINPIDKTEVLSIPKIWPDNYICSVGRPSFQKNIELMLDVIFEIKKSINDIHLVLMGVGYHSPNLEEVKRKIKALGLEKNITLLEWTSREDIFNIIKGSKLYLTTARYEGLPYSIIESLSLGKAIVATDADGNRDLVEDGYNGRLIFNENISDLAQAVVEIINSDKINKTYSSNSLQLFNDNFDITKNISKLENIYLNNINQKE
ncbi:glycosyltransferase family 4 protein [Tamlana sp. 2_MG-2023]|uniref:glycosyltransferase family 4 protein n=1 Tax=unclassified Tamlana TaxID=2614803 RepID=UPI0026E1A1C9|nr:MULTISPECIES: glycosyltransferase family 4 protein [unclassified Tamlana]MDO6759756.1 glycosyltransferase family 4 protein [Tamlana sp. 2_MG-2023]MDO6791379.1 glycosyltransferase family 4 protein [Tamlana sp. 1_MG-2023]